MSGSYHQAAAPIFESQRRPEYASQHAQLHANPSAPPPRAPESSRRSPLPSAREIDAALERKYGPGAIEHSRVRASAFA